MAVKYVVEWIGPEGEEESKEYVSSFHANNRANAAPEGWRSQITEIHTNVEPEVGMYSSDLPIDDPRYSPPQEEETSMESESDRRER